MKTYIFLFVIASFIALFLINHKLKNQSENSSLIISGILEADEAAVGSRIGGRVERLHAAEGQHVKAGDVIVELEAYDLNDRLTEAHAQLKAAQAELALFRNGHRPEDIAIAAALCAQSKAELDKVINGPREQQLAIARARLSQAEAEAALAQERLTHRQQLAQATAISQEEMNIVTTEVKSATARLTAARAELDELEAGTRAEEIAAAQAAYDAAVSELERMKSGYRVEEIARAEALHAAAEARIEILRKQQNELRITAPIDGVINSMDVVKGEMLSPNQATITILDESHFWLRGYVPQNRMKLALGDVAKVVFDAYPNQSFEGRITFISSQAEFTPSNIQTSDERSKMVYRIKVTIDDRNSHLRSGMTADILF